MAFDAFLKLDGIEGESQKEGHTKEIELRHWSWGGQNSGSFAVGSGGGTGKYATQDISFSTPCSQASAKLFAACTKGSHIGKGVICVRKSGGDSKPYDTLKITLENCLVSSHAHGGSSGGDDLGEDSFTINFSKVTYEYFVQDATKGTVASTGAHSHNMATGVSAS